MARIDDLILTALRTVGPKPSNEAKQSEKKAYSEKLSAVVALAIAKELRIRGLDGTRPAGQGEIDSKSGAERRMAGGIGAKKVDVTWATEESGLLLGISIKTINFRDSKTGNFQKNLTNRRGDMLMEAVTLHRRFPYAVLGAFFFLDAGAASDDIREGRNHVLKRRSTFMNAHARLKLFTGRSDPAGRDEQYERFYILLIDTSIEPPSVQAFQVGQANEPLSLETILDELLSLVAERNPDFYEFDSEEKRLLKLQN